MTVPSTTDLLLTLHIRDLAVRRREHEIKVASGASYGERNYVLTEKAWDKDIDFYIADVTKELVGLWGAIQASIQRPNVC